MIISYCCVCERETSHREVYDDEVFEFGLECLVCHIVWEAEKPSDSPEDENILQ